MTIKTNPAPKCPNCGYKMQIRFPKKDDKWKEFWGCMRYPDCNGSRNILPNGRWESKEIDKAWKKFGWPKYDKIR